MLLFVLTHHTLLGISWNIANGILWMLSNGDDNYDDDDHDDESED